MFRSLRSFRNLNKNQRFFVTANVEKLLTEFPSKVSISREEFNETCEKLQIDPQEAMDVLPTFNDKIVLDSERVGLELSQVMDMKRLKREIKEDEEQLEELKEKFHTISLEREKCEEKVDSRLTRWKIGGCLFLTIQGATLAKMTWIDYGWDITEPISYFVMFTVVVWSMAYFSVFKHDYNVIDILKRFKENKLIMEYQKRKFDIIEFEELQNQIENLEKKITKNKKLLGI
eukprot:gene10532-3053_t